MSDRGVSEVIGFVLIFGLVVSTLGIVYVSGFSGLEDARNAERLNNAERAFDVLGDNLADIYTDSAPSRKTEIKLADAQLSMAEPTTIEVTVEDIHVDDDPNQPLIVYEADTRPVVFSTDGLSEIVYENGAVIRTDRGGAILQRDPPMLIDEERTVIGYVVISPTSGTTTSVGGDATVLVRSVRSGNSVLVQDESDAKVTLTIQTASDRAPIWEAYINERADWPGSDWAESDNVPCDTNDLGSGRSEVVCTFQPEEFYLTSTGIETEFVT